MLLLLVNEVRHAATAAKSLRSCPTLCDPIDGSPPGCLVPGILQAKTLEWVAISFSNAWKWKVKVKLLSRVWLLATPWTAAYQAPPSMGFSRQEYWNRVPLPSPILLPRTEHEFRVLLWLPPKERRVSGSMIAADILIIQPHTKDRQFHPSTPKHADTCP